MAQKPSFGLPLAIVLFLSAGALSPAAVGGQQAARLGSAPAGLRLERMLLLLEPPAERQQALATELAAQQSLSSHEYHRWLTPAAFAAAYANPAADVEEVSAWLESQGFQVAPLPAGRGWIEFSGTVAQFERAFQARVELAASTGQPRAVLAGGITLPPAIKPLVHGLVSLDGSLSVGAVTAPRPVTAAAAELAAAGSLAKAEAMTPRLAAGLLNLDAVHASGVKGTGQNIAIAARSNVNPQDVAAFRSAFSLPASSLSVVPSGVDPGRAADEAQAVLTASWAGVAAPGAQIVLVPAATTAATDGVDLSLAAIVDKNLAHTVAVGYSACEAGMSEAHQAFYAALYKQAAAQGMAMIVATGDSGAAACHAAGGGLPVSSGYSVNALAATPWNTAVGVAGYLEAGPSGSNAALSGWSQATAAEPAYAGGGGSSTFYAAPAWQATQTAAASSSPAGRKVAPLNEQLRSAGLAAGHRLLPDVVLPAAMDSGVNRGLAFCLGSTASSGGCTAMRAGGSSAATALFAGVAALLAEKDGAQGNLSPALYSVSSQSGVFTDVTAGSAVLHCTAGTPGCGVQETIGFAAGAGFDLATGLGTVDAEALVKKWPQPMFGSGPAHVTNAITPSQTINPSGSVVLAAVVTSQNAGSAPTGNVDFYDNSTSPATDVAIVPLVAGTGSSSTASTTITGVLSVGGHPMVVSYEGDSNYAPASESVPVVIEVAMSATTTTIIPATNSPTPGSSLQVTANITSLNAGAGASPPSGTIDFRLDGVSQGVVVVTEGSPSSASIDIAVPYVAGTHQIVGFYSGDTNYNNSTSQAASITVPTSAPTVTITPSSTTPPAGGNLVINATITPPAGAGNTSPTGQMSFTVDGTSVGTVTVIPVSGSPSIATITIATPSIGIHTLQGSYGGDSNYSSAQSNSAQINVALVSTTLTLTPTTLTPTTGSSLLLTATLHPATNVSTAPTGTVTFTLDGVGQGTPVDLSGLVATTTVTVPSAGTHNVQAAYSGDSNYSSSSSTTVALNVAKMGTTLTLTPSSTTPSAGSTVTVTATIGTLAQSSSQPSGTVSFTLDGTVFSTAQVTQGSPSTATATTAALAPGSHVLAASYLGDSSFASSTATAVGLSVAKSPTTIVISPSTLTPAAGSTLVITATISSTNPSATGPSGTVTVFFDGASVGSGTVTPGSPSTASVSFTVPAAGTHAITATYSGDTYYSTSSTAGSVSIVASKGATTTSLAVTGTPTLGTLTTTWTLTATVTPSGTTSVVTGTVSFYDNGTLVAAPAVVTSTGLSYQATATVSLANSKSHSITAVYSGDTNWLPSASSAVPIAAVTLPDYVVLTSNYSLLNPAPPGASVILVATVTPYTTPTATQEQNPTGQVVFYDTVNGVPNVIGEVALVATPLSYSSTATLTTHALPGGQDTITAVYLGDLYYSMGTSNPLLLDVEDFTIVPDPSIPPVGLTIVQGAAGSATFDIAGLGGFNGQIQVVCAVNPQDDMTCLPSPQQVTPNATVTFTVQTFSSGNVTSGTNHAPLPPWSKAAGGTALAMLAFFLLPFGRRARTLLEKQAGRGARRLLVLVLLFGGLGVAGLGCNNVTLVSAPGTPLGQTTLKITATDFINNTVFSHSVFLVVNVIARP